LSEGPRINFVCIHNANFLCSLDNRKEIRKLFYMLDAAFQNELLHEVEQLSPFFQERVLEYARSLKKKSPKSDSGKDLLEFAGIMTPDEAKEFLRSIEEDCGCIYPAGK
jgi:hypothetical protein